MILVVLAVCVALIILGMVIVQNSKHYNGAGAAMTGVGITGGIVALVATVVLCCSVTSDCRIDEKISMYTEENIKIEQQIAGCVERYQAYEQGVFEKVAPSDAVTLITIYPELKSDTLVQAQIEAYTENSNMIKVLREQKIDARVRKWWLYFG